jgi:predicted dehydrogenase
MKKLRIAVIGAGRLGGFHARKLAAFEDVELAAVVDPVAARREQTAAECRAQPLADHRELIGEVDAAVIAAPTSLHHPLALDFLGAGAHVLVEKPLCPTAAEAEELVDAARRAGLVLQVGHVERFNPAFHAVAAYVEDPKYVEALRCGPYTFRSTDVGVVLDLMIHDIDLLLAMVRSPVRRVEALGVSVLGGHEDVANARIAFESGCVATLSASRVARESTRRMQLWSPHGHAAVDFAARSAALTRPSETLLRRQLDLDALGDGEPEDGRRRLIEEHLPQETLSFAAVDALRLELRDFVESIRRRRAPRVPGESGRDAVAVAERILDSIREHAWDDAHDGPVGPLAVPRPRVAASSDALSAPPAVIPLPLPAGEPIPRREAG